MAHGVKRETGQQLRELQVDHGAAKRQLAAVQEASERAQAKLQAHALTYSMHSQHTLMCLPRCWCTDGRQLRQAWVHLVQAEVAAAEEAREAALLRASTVEEQAASLQQVGLPSTPIA